MGFFQYFSRLRRYNNTMRELNRLSDRELRDIGLNRDDFERIAREASVSK